MQNSQCNGTVSYKKNKLHFERSKFKEFFKEAVDGVVRHINGILSEHVCSDLKDIIMVGGFSECELIQNDLKEEFKAHHFRIPANPGLAVLNGAVYFGHLTGVLATVSVICMTLYSKNCIYYTLACYLFLKNVEVLLLCYQLTVLFGFMTVTCPV